MYDDNRSRIVWGKTINPTCVFCRSGLQCVFFKKMLRQISSSYVRYYNAITFATIIAMQLITNRIMPTFI